MSNDIIINIEQVSKTYQSGSSELNILRDFSLAVRRGGSCALVGPSGSGKTTLLALCAGLDQPSKGRVVLNGTDLSSLNEDQRAQFRRQHIGFVFQNFQLLPTLTALENVMLPLELQGEKNPEPQAEELLSRVGLAERLQHYPVQLSGGEQQRVAIARAYIHRPLILFADEPTGNLDHNTSERITELLFELNQSAKTTLLLATHDNELAERTNEVINLGSLSD